MTLNEALSDLTKSDPDAGLHFTTDGKPIRGGYHVTEFQVAQIRSMTCGGKTDAWDEARVQLMDGHGTQSPMSVGRFLHISGLVAERFPEMGGLPLSIELAPNNKGLHIYRPERPVDAGDKVTLPLRSAQAVCKAALTTSCCGTGPDVCCAAA
ncbi:MAG: hypothetical protein JKY00_02535 [Roseicyclus sp.]|nr:hypothetical protein [Roseicyclus sp.]